MKYSILSITAFLAASSLGFPEYYQEGNANNPKFVDVTNNINHPVEVEYFPQKQHVYEPEVTDKGVIIPYGETRRIWTSAGNADLKIKVENARDWQVELSYNTAPPTQRTYNFALKPIGSDNFPGHVIAKPVGHNLPDTCHILRWRPGGDATRCPNGTPIQVSLSPGQHRQPFEVPYYGAGWY